MNASVSECESLSETLKAQSQNGLIVIILLPKLDSRIDSIRNKPVLNMFLCMEEYLKWVAFAQRAETENVCVKRA